MLEKDDKYYAIKSNINRIGTEQKYSKDTENKRMKMKDLSERLRQNYKPRIL